jgi:hypothetical protein
MVLTALHLPANAHDFHPPTFLFSSISNIHQPLSQAWQIKKDIQISQAEARSHLVWGFSFFSELK